MSKENCIYIDDYDPATVHSTKTIRARKEHTCTECGETIKVGLLYEAVRGKWDGRWDYFKTCARCVLVRSDYFVGWLYGGMVENFLEAHGFDYRDGIPPDFTPCNKGEIR